MITQQTDSKSILNVAICAPRDKDAGVLRPVFHTLPLTDAKGNAILDEAGEPVTKEYQAAHWFTTDGRGSHGAWVETMSNKAMRERIVACFAEGASEDEAQIAQGVVETFRAQRLAHAFASRSKTNMFPEPRKDKSVPAPKVLFFDWFALKPKAIALTPDKVQAKVTALVGDSADAKAAALAALMADPAVMALAQAMLTAKAEAEVKA